MNVIDWLVKNPIKGILYIGFALIGASASVITKLYNQQQAEYAASNGALRAEVADLKGQLKAAQSDNVVILRGIIADYKASERRQDSVIISTQKIINKNEKIISNI